MTRLLIMLAVLAALWCAPFTMVHAQQSIDVHVGSASAVPGNEVDVFDFGTMGFEISGTFVGELTFKGKMDPAASFAPVMCKKMNDGTFTVTATEPGLYQCPSSSLYRMLVPITSYTSGSISVKARRGTQSSSSSGAGGVTGWPSSAITKIVTWANSVANALGIGNGTDYVAIYVDPTDGPTVTCFIVSINNCDKYVKLNPGKKWGLKNNAGTTVLEYDDAGAITKGFRDERHFPVATCQAGTASATFDLPSSNAPAAVCDAANTNSTRAYLAFDDTTDETFFDSWIWPVGATSVDVVLRWKGVNITNAVGWCAQLVRVPDGANPDPALPAQAAGNCVSDTAKGTTLQENVATIVDVTCTSCVAGDRIVVGISRDANGGAVTDSFVGDALLLTYGRIFKS